MLEQYKIIKHFLYRIMINFYPSYFGTGGKILFIALDWKKIIVCFQCNWRTRNIQNIAFGGSIYSSLDPIIAIQISHILGKKYVVLDKSAKIQYLKPVKTKVYCESIITNELIETIKCEVAQHHRYCFEEVLEYKNEKGTIFAKITKEVYVADKYYFNNRHKREYKKF
jgi:acyl-coenzyme A thioesterase PaaI-like protein